LPDLINPSTIIYLNSLITNGNHSHALKTQLIFLLNRYSQQMEIRQKGLFHKTTVSDYIFTKDGIYAHLLLSSEELDIYKKIFRIFSENVVSSDLVIYLQISFTEMMRGMYPVIIGEKFLKPIIIIFLIINLHLFW